jgi:hypothetical protein
MPDEVPLHPVSRRHLDVLGGDLGIMQHAIGSEPDPTLGYCTDDVARALQVDLLHARELGWPAVGASAWRNFHFLDEALDRATGRFRNFRRFDGTWNPEPGSEDSHGRAMLALGETIAAPVDDRLVESADRLFSEALPASQSLGALRARASVVLGCDAALRVASGDRAALAYRLVAGRIRSEFASRPPSAWPWPESRLTYENALVARALLVAGRYFDSPPIADLGLLVLDWLSDIQTSPAGHLTPIGNGWWQYGGVRSQFDQQPIEATALLLAAETAFELTGDDRYRATVERAYAWFLGANDTGVAVADPERGACRDGLTPSGSNENQGAESTLMWLIALEHVRTMRGAGSVNADGALVGATA